MTTPATPASRLNFSDNGVRSDAPVVVLIHGAGGQARDWPVEWRYTMNASQCLGVRALPPTAALSGHRVIAVDLPGHGASVGQPCSSVADYADAVARLLEEEGIFNAVVVGHSMGGGIALHLALGHPERVGGVVVIGSAARLGVTPEILDGLATNFEATVNMIVKFSWARGAPSVYREIGRRHMLAVGPDTVLADFKACADYTVRDRLGEIACPVLVVAGGADKMVPAKASRALADGVRRGTYVEIEGAGHFMHFENTRDVTGAIKPFLASVAA